MIVHSAIYNKVTGCIRQVETGQDCDILAGCRSEEAVLLCTPRTHPDTHIVVDGQVVTRVATLATWDIQSIAATGINEAHLTGLPVPCTICVDEIAIHVDDGTFVLTASTPGTYYVVLDEVAYLRKEWEINAN